MKGQDLAQSATSGADELYLQLVDAQELCRRLLAENETLKVENELLKVMAGDLNDN
jgi:regulator of replication initiation timing